MKLGVAAAAIIIAAVIAWWMWPRDNAPPAARPTAGATTASTFSSSLTPPRHVTRISPDERQRIADRITTAQRGHVAPPGPRPSLPPLPDTDTHDLERVESSLQDAMTEAIPILADCYEKTGHTEGTSSDIKLVQSGPLDPPLDNCLRDTFRSLELPPLHEGDKLHIKYTFKFGDDKK